MSEDELKDGQVDTPIVSVGIPTYNRAVALERRLRNVLSQSYASIEVIVSDNNSPDPRVGEVLEKAAAEDQRLKVHRQRRNIGATANFRFVLEEATGQYFVWAADDDEWEPDFLIEAVAGIGNAGLYLGRAETVEWETGRIAEITLPSLEPSQGAAKNLRDFLANMQPSLIYGLQTTENARKHFPAGAFDFSDCYFLIGTILDAGIRVGRSSAYRAGILGQQYEVKPVEKALSFAPFVLRSLKAIGESARLTVSEKARVSFQLLNQTAKTLAHLSAHYPEKTRAGDRVLGAGIRGITKLRGALRARRNVAARNRPSPRQSYSQSGEDLIVEFALAAMGVERPTYLDVGANHPYRFSNTFAMYERGCRGVTVEPDASMVALLRKLRPGDTHLQIGIAQQGGAELTLFVMSEPTLNTFSETEARRYEALGTHKVIEKRKVEVQDINAVLERYFPDRAPDFLSLDVEGLDHEILSTLDFDRHRPAAICVETVIYDEQGLPQQDESAVRLLTEKGYFLYGSTTINSIFIDRVRWLLSRSGRSE